MAIRTWRVAAARPVFAYNSLALAALFPGHSEVTLIADARRGTWHHYRAGENLRRVTADQLQGALATPQGFKAWTPLPESVRTVPYSVSEALAAHADVPLFTPTDEPDAFLHEAPTYVGWTPQIHRAP
jgi:tRNA threonylcarbamoyladenosine biosynthesis protein TsaB